MGQEKWCLVREAKREKMVGSRSFLPEPTIWEIIVFSSKLGRKLERKVEERVGWWKIAHLPFSFSTLLFFFFHQCYFFFNFNFFSLYTIIIIIFLELRAEEKIICLLYFLSFHFSSQQIKKFLSLYFFTSNQVFWQKNKYIFFFYFFTSFPFYILTCFFIFLFWETIYSHVYIPYFFITFPFNPPTLLYFDFEIHSIRQKSLRWLIR